MKIIRGNVISDIPSKSIGASILDTIRYRAARDKKPSKLQAYHSKNRYFRIIRQAKRYDLFMTLKVYGTGNTAAHHRHIVSIKKQGMNNISRSTLKWRWFNDYRYKNKSLR